MTNASESVNSQHHQRRSSLQDWITTILIARPLFLGLFIRLALALLLPVFLDDGVLMKGVKYTDVDYYVFTDAATHVFQGRSPYLRHTYRYTPFLASFLAWPMREEAGWWWDQWRDKRYFGRIIFCLADGICGQIIISLRRAGRKIDTADHKEEASRKILNPHLVDACWWLYNPLAINICTRGSAESLVVLLPVLLAVTFANPNPDPKRGLGTAEKDRWLVILHALVAGVVLGVAVHAKLYPVIYTVSFMASFSRQEQQLMVEKQRQNIKEKKVMCWNMVLSPEDVSKPVSGLGKKSTADCSCIKETRRGYEMFPWTRPLRLLQLIGLWSKRLFLTPSSLIFLSSLGLTFSSLTALAVKKFGHEALEEGLLYHFSRVDHRHNYSSFWYWIYLARGRLNNANASGAFGGASEGMTTSSNPMSTLGLLFFIPQAVLILYTSLGLAPYDLPYALFVQTFLFVAHNKVITAQYFTWYLCLLPLCSDRIQWRSRKLVTSLLLLGLSIICWLGSAYCLEMRGMSVHYLVWLASIGFFAANVNLLGAMVSEYMGYEKA